MRGLLHSIAAPLMAIAVLCPAVAATSDLPLSRVAAQSGYAWSWLGAERSVEISKPGMLIVIRPGQSLFEVNDRIETTAVAPRYAHNDLYITQSFANRIAQLARQADQNSVAMNQSADPVRNVVAQASAISGAIQMEVHQLPGSEALLVTGNAPPNAPVTITLYATFATDLPTVVVSRHDAHPDASGRFSTIVPIAPAYFRGVFLDVLASSLPGVKAATAQYVVGSPNGNVNIPATTFSNSVL